MAVSLFNCWNCEKRLESKRVEVVTKGSGKNKTTETVLDDNFFYCDAKCREAHEKKQEEISRPFRQWSEYMCGEREKAPRQFAHLVEKYGWAKDRKAVTVDEDEPEEKSEGRKCGKCGKSGHNARTCGKQEVVPAKKPPTKGKKGPKKKSSRKKAVGRTQYRCGICEGIGHNARSCDRRPLEPGEFAPKLKVEKVGKYKCGHCSKLGHNARTCPEKNG